MGCTITEIHNATEFHQKKTKLRLCCNFRHYFTEAQMRTIIKKTRKYDARRQSPLLKVRFGFKQAMLMMPNEDEYGHAYFQHMNTIDKG